MNRLSLAWVCFVFVLMGCTGPDPVDRSDRKLDESGNDQVEEQVQTPDPPPATTGEPKESSVSPFQPSARPPESVDLKTESSYATPEDALRAFYMAIDANDLKTAEEATVSVTKGFQDAYLKGMFAQPAAIKRFNLAVKKAFGADTKLLPSTGEKLAAKIESIPVQYANLKVAIWKHAPDEQIRVIKLDNGWVIDLREMERMASDQSTFEAMHQLADFLVEIAERVEKGELKSPDEIRAEFKKYKGPK